MEASRSGNTEIVQLLLEKGANPNKTNSVRTDVYNVCTNIMRGLVLLYFVSLLRALTVSLLTGELDSTDGSSQ